MWFRQATSELMQKLPRDRVRGRDRESPRDRGRDRESPRDRGRGRESSKERGRGRESPRDRGRSRENSRDRDGGRGSSRDRGRDRESSRDRGRERESSRDFDRDRRVGSRTSGGGREDIRQSSADKPRRYNDYDAADLRKQDAYDDDDRRPVGRDRGRRYEDDDRRPMGRDRGRDYEDDERRPTGRDRGRGYDEERRPMSRDRDGGYEDDGRRPMGGGRGRGRGWGGRGRGDRDNDKLVAPPLYSIHKATVHSIRPFGIFVQMEGYRNHGLVHLSQVSDHEVRFQAFKLTNFLKLLWRIAYQLRYCRCSWATGLGDGVVGVKLQNYDCMQV